MTEPQAEISLEQSNDRQATWRARSRWVVHLGLLCSAAAAFGTLQLLHVSDTSHIIVGFVFVGLVAIHLVQRRRTIARMATRLVRTQTFGARITRLAVSDLLLFFIGVNMLVSGIIDWDRGQPTQLPLPVPFDRWHLDSGLVLAIYLLVHTWRRRKRLWRSTIR